MRKVFIIMILLFGLFIASCKYIKVKNIDVMEDPNQMTIIINKGLR